MYEPSGRQSANLAFLWPAFVAAATGDMAALAAKHFANLAVGPAGSTVDEPGWATPHSVGESRGAPMLKQRCGDRRIENSLPVLLEGRQRARFVGPHQPRITKHVGRKDSHELTVDTFFGHGCARFRPDGLNVRGHFEKSTGERPLRIVAFGVEMKTIPVQVWDQSSLDQ